MLILPLISSRFVVLVGCDYDYRIVAELFLTLLFSVRVENTVSIKYSINTRSTLNISNDNRLRRKSLVYIITPVCRHER